MHTTRIYPPKPDPFLHDALAVTTAASNQLKKLGIRVYEARLSTSHMPVLSVNALPTGIHFHRKSKRREPNGDVHFVHAATWGGVYLEWPHTLAKQEVRHA